VTSAARDRVKSISSGSPANGAKLAGMLVRGGLERAPPVLLRSELFEMMDKLAAVEPALTPEEIDAEIKTARAERRARADRR
ncbi:MAG: hypothetical protein AB1671_29145, partial [Thermodesulfobacteriota bacterium]